MDVILISSDSSNPPSPVSDVHPKEINCVDDNESGFESQNTRESNTNSVTLNNHTSPSSDNLAYDLDDDLNPVAPKFTSNLACGNEFEDEKERNLPGVACTSGDTELRPAPGAYSSTIVRNTLEPSSDELDIQPKVTKRRRVNNEEAKAERERKQAERKQRQAEAAQAKALKKAATEALRANRPGECIKYMQVMLDQSLLKEEYGAELLLALQGAELQYTIQEQVIPHTVTWVRTVQEHMVDDNMKIQISSSLKEEDQVLVIKPWDQVLSLIHDQALRSLVQSIQGVHSSKKLTLIVYGMEDYYRFQKAQKQPSARGKERGCGAKKGAALKAAPRVSKSDMEMSFAELQLMEQCGHRLVDSAQELGELVAHFTKAIAEKPFKLQKQQEAKGKLEWYATGDSRDCVRVDKNGMGLQRLWRQQLCQFHLVGLDVAEAIVSLYPSPQALMQAYDRCSTQKEGEQLLKDIPIRRGVGPLTTVRKVGPELSRKVYILFNSVDGNTPLTRD